MDKKINRKLLVLGGLIVLALALSSLAPRLLDKPCKDRAAVSGSGQMLLGALSLRVQ